MRRQLLIALLLAALSAPAGAAKYAPKPVKTKTPARAATVTKQSLHFTVTSTAAGYVDPMLAICEASLDGYRDLFGLSLYPNPNPGDKRTVVVVTPNAAGKSFFTPRWDTRPAELRLMVPATAGAAKPAAYGPQTVFSLTRELARPVAAFDNEPFNAGLMDYLGAHVVDYAAAKLDAQRVPRSEDWVQLAGTGQFTRWGERAQPGGEAAAALLLYRVANAHGKEAIGKALRLLALEQPPARPLKIAALCRQLMDLTGDGEIEEWFREAHFPTVADPQNVTAAELWALPTHAARCQVLCTRWGTGAIGPLEGSQAQALLQVASGERAKTTASTPEGVRVKAADAKGVIAWYQPATRRIYVIGSVTVQPSGVTVTDDAIDAQGQPLHLNPAVK